MSERDSSRPEMDDSSEQLNAAEAIRRLKEAGFDIEYDDEMGVDENDFLGNLVSLALESGSEPEELFLIAGIPVDKFGQGE